MVLVILIAIWAVVLIPPWVRGRREDRPAESIVTFHRRLSTLERTSGYATYSDEMYLDASYYDGLGEGVGDDDPAGGGLVDPSLEELERLEGVARLQPLSPTPRAMVAERAGSRRALQRRRQIFFGLLLAVAGSLGAAALIGSVMAWAVHASVGVLFLTYVSLLVHHHHQALEHAAKVRYLSPIRTPRPAVVVLRSGAAR